MKINIKSTCQRLLFFSLMFVSSVYAFNIDKIIVFGDSLSDNGNIYSVTQRAHKIISKIPIIPKESAYYKGRFSNGPVWVEYLAIAMNVPLVNYAYGGAWAEPFIDSGLIFPFGLDEQMDMYLASAATDYDIGNHLFIIWAGGNDYLHGRDDPEYATTETVKTIKNNIDWLVYYGAKHIIVLDVPDLTLVPMVIADGPDAVENVDKLVKLHNAKIAVMIKQLKRDNQGINFILGEVAVTMDDIIYHPEKYHLKNSANPCYDGGFWLQSVINQEEIDAAKKMNIDILASPALKLAYINGKSAFRVDQFCKNPDEYVFWDEIHPTKAVHKIMTEVMLDILNKNGIYGSLVN